MPVPTAFSDLSTTAASNSPAGTEDRTTADDYLRQIHAFIRSLYEGSTNGQIVFPATQNASAGANTLDDYEEGTWTPAISFGGATTGITYTTQAGSYTKVGRLVHVQGNVKISSNGSAQGALRITGLPFAVGFGGGVGTGQFGAYSGMINVSGSIFMYGEGGTTTALVSVAGAANHTALTDSNVSDTADVFFSITYEASA